MCLLFETFWKNLLFQTCFFLFRTLFSTHGFYSKHVFSYLDIFFPPMCFIPNIFFYLEHFFPSMVFIPNMFYFNWITFFHPCVLFQTCFFLFGWIFFHPCSLFQTHCLNIPFAKSQSRTPIIGQVHQVGEKRRREFSAISWSHVGLVQIPEIWSFLHQMETVIPLALGKWDWKSSLASGHLKQFSDSMAFS